MPRISLIHATPLSVEPVNSAFSEQWPDAEVYNLLEDSLAPDIAKAGHLTPSMHDRFVRLAVYAKDTGANAILFTCSAFGPAIEDAAQAVSPLVTLKPNEAMFNEALKSYQRIGMVATFEPSLAPMKIEFEKMAQEIGSSATLETAHAEGAMEILACGDTGKHNALIAEAAIKLADCDAIMLAQFSMAKARDVILKNYDRPVLTSPTSAITALKAALN